MLPPQPQLPPAIAALAVAAAPRPPAPAPAPRPRPRPRPRPWPRPQAAQTLLTLTAAPPHPLTQLIAAAAAAAAASVTVVAAAAAAAAAAGVRHCLVLERRPASVPCSSRRTRRPDAADASGYAAVVSPAPRGSNFAPAPDLLAPFLWASPSPGCGAAVAAAVAVAAAGAAAGAAGCSGLAGSAPAGFAKALGNSPLLGCVAYPKPLPGHGAGAAEAGESSPAA